MFLVDVRFELGNLTRGIEGMARSQIPFAMARALTLTAKDARDDLRRGAQRRFVLRSKWVERGIQSRSASKRSLVSSVGSVDWFMEDQETGGIRTALKGRHRAAPLGIRKNVRQKITRAKRPSALLQKSGRRRFFIRRLVSGSAKGQLAVLRRVGRQRFPVQVAYLLQRKTKIKPKFGMRKSVERTVGRRLSKNFGAAFGRALATTR